MTQGVRSVAQWPLEPYSAPELKVHGAVSDLTSGTLGFVPDVGAAGSSFPDDNNPI